MPNNRLTIKMMSVHQVSKFGITQLIQGLNLLISNLWQIMNLLISALTSIEQFLGCIKQLDQKNDSHGIAIQSVHSNATKILAPTANEVVPPSEEPSGIQPCLTSNMYNFIFMNIAHLLKKMVECSSRIAQLKPIIIITMDTPNILGYRIVLL